MRRAKQENDTGVRLGFQAYLQFYTALQGSAKNKTYEDFSNSDFYSAFVKYGQYLVQLRAINIPLFTKQLLDNNRKLDAWTKDVYYDEYLYEYLRKEHPNDALERSFAEMQRWADDNPGKRFNDIFREGSPNKICQMITNGRISPWIIYNCPSGVQFLSELNSEQIMLVFKWIDPAFWDKKFKDFVSDTLWIKDILEQACI
jgi:hypothetical protein